MHKVLTATKSMNNSGNAKIIKPNKQVLGYPVIDFQLVKELFTTEETHKILGNTDGAAEKSVTAQTPATFIWTTQTDELVPVANTLVYVNELQKAGVNYEAHIFGWGPHGLAMSNNQTNYLPLDGKHDDRSFVNYHTATWFKLAIDWLEKDEYGIK